MAFFPINNHVGGGGLRGSKVEELRELREKRRKRERRRKEVEALPNRDRDHPYIVLLFCAPRATVS